MSSSISTASARAGISAATAVRVSSLSRRAGFKPGSARRSESKRQGRSSSERRPGRMRPKMPLFRYNFFAMASANELQIWADAESDARTGADAAIGEVSRIEAKYSRYRDDSVIASINREAGNAPVAIDAETAALLRYADQCY